MCPLSSPHAQPALHHIAPHDSKGMCCSHVAVARANPETCSERSRSRVCAIVRALPGARWPLVGGFLRSRLLVGEHTGQVRTWAEEVRRRGCPTRGAAPANLKSQMPSGPPHNPHARFSRASSPGACAVRDRQVRLGRDAPTPRPGPFYTASAATPRTPVCAPQRGWGASLGPHHCWVRMPFEPSTSTTECHKLCGYEKKKRKCLTE